MEPAFLPTRTLYFNKVFVRFAYPEVADSSLNHKTLNPEPDPSTTQILFSFQSGIPSNGGYEAMVVAQNVSMARLSKIPDLMY